MLLQKRKSATLAPVKKPKAKKKPDVLAPGRPPIHDKPMARMLRVRFSEEEWALLLEHVEATNESMSDAARRGLRRIGVLK